MKISEELTPLAYEISKKVYNKEISFSDGQKIIVGDKRMNKNSAADYINDFRCLIDGKRFTRTLNAFSMNYFLENILEDYGNEALENSLNALLQHIEYYEDIQKVTMHKMRNIYDNFSKNIFIENLDEKEQEEIIKELKTENKSKAEILKELLNLKESEQQIVIIKGKAYKRDNKTIAQIKFLRDFSCQFCGQSILKKDGSKYIEAAHIKPKHLKGKECLENIILLCPNHHKEFDLGNLKIIIHTKEKLEVIVNNVNYKINFEL
ncbi:HNH endonuclease [Halpernia sp.]|uniref:HNH endonuclease n=1 Tax=Halpernia sp. TaxID=2782209 RepID=UPI003A8D9560